MAVDRWLQQLSSPTAAIARQQSETFQLVLSLFNLRLEPLLRINHGQVNVCSKHIMIGLVLSNVPMWRKAICWVSACFPCHAQQKLQCTRPSNFPMNTPDCFQQTRALHALYSCKGILSRNRVATIAQMVLSKPGKGAEAKGAGAAGNTTEAAAER